ncbi:MAG: M20/M25/M40 family metallo-hydrolase [bacterium]|nr:M20/M25/M40 family metallo-hydrolase [bacterium]
MTTTWIVASAALASLVLHRGSAQDGVASAPAPAAALDPVPEWLAAVRPERLRADVDRLVGFGTRHSFSETESETRGVGAARRWLEAELRAISAATGGRLEVGTQTYTIEPRRGDDAEPVQGVNVFGFLPGTQGDRKGRTYVVSGHYDSLAVPFRDSTIDAPGADDDASGTAVVLELARVLAGSELEANLVFLCVAGEEQGLFGAKHYAQVAEEEGIEIDGMITNDIVGGVEGGNGVRDDVTVRCFSASEGLNGPSRELARSLKEAAERYVPDARVKLVFRLDRFGRGGDHKPFHDGGWPAVRLTEANENYSRQHKAVSVVDGVQEGDLAEHTDEHYMARVARVNGALLAQLALAPARPPQLSLRAALRYDTRLQWKASPSEAVRGYVVVWRDTTAAEWQFKSPLIEDLETVIDFVTADSSFFGVRAVGPLGHESRTTHARRP